MPIADANGIKITYDMRGPAGAPAILLIMGLGTQMTAWSDPFCDALAAGGYRVVRFDNRDVGLSSKFEHAPAVNMRWAFFKAMLGLKVRGPYSLDDMAADALGLMDTLGLDAAHVVGASMGGMIAQIIAAAHPRRARSLVSIMSSSGHRRLPQATRKARNALLSKPPAASDREQVIAHVMNVYRVIGSPGYPVPEEVLRPRLEAAISRSYYPQGIGRQLLAVLADGSRVERLGTIKVPTLVIHGADDPLVPVAAGKHTAQCIPGAKLEIVPGMGHDLPPGLVTTLTGLILDHCRTVDARARAAA
ncbi:MAG TPA: alpha/beta fold hydrolase [Vineibacter sp.]|nr:alpha/beta fold hydrolase [Vineibacter sp.]